MKTLAQAAVQGAACGVMIGAVLLVGGRVWRPAAVAAQAPAVADVVKARRFVAVDEAGEIRAILTGVTASKDGPSSALHMYDAAGKSRQL